MLPFEKSSSPGTGISSGPLTSRRAQSTSSCWLCVCSLELGSLSAFLQDGAAVRVSRRACLLLARAPTHPGVCSWLAGGRRWTFSRAWLRKRSADLQPATRPSCQPMSSCPLFGWRIDEISALIAIGELLVLHDSSADSVTYSFRA